MTAQQPEARALYLARELEAGSFMPNILQNENGLRINSAAELRRLHARVQELEARQERKPLSEEQAMALVSEVMQETGVTFTGNGVYCAVQIAKRAHGITQEKP